MIILLSIIAIALVLIALSIPAVREILIWILASPLLFIGWIADDIKENWEEPEKEYSFKEIIINLVFGTTLIYLAILLHRSDVSGFLQSLF